KSKQMFEQMFNICPQIRAKLLYPLCPGVFEAWCYVFIFSLCSSALLRFKFSRICGNTLPLPQRQRLAPSRRFLPNWRQLLAFLPCKIANSAAIPALPACQFGCNSANFANSESKGHTFCLMYPSVSLNLCITLLSFTGNCQRIVA